MLPPPMRNWCGLDGAGGAHERQVSMTARAVRIGAFRTRGEGSRWCAIRAATKVIQTGGSVRDLGNKTLPRTFHIC